MEILPASPGRLAPRPPARGWGGARAGAGRPARGPVASEPHGPRPALSAHHPVHVTARLEPALRSLSRRAAHAALQRAVRRSLARTDFRIVRLVVRRAQVELLVEADDRRALARGMQGLQVAAARALNAAAGRHGRCFPDRYRARILRTPAAIRSVLPRLPAPGPRPARPGAVTGDAAPSSPRTHLLAAALAREHARARRRTRSAPIGR